MIVGTITGISRIQKSGEQERIKGPITETIIRDSRLVTRNELRTNTVTFRVGTTTGISRISEH